MTTQEEKDIAVLTISDLDNMSEASLTVLHLKFRPSFVLPITRMPVNHS